jgi:hypothetical protein
VKTEQNKGRPFAVGDMVISTNGEVGILRSIKYQWIMGDGETNFANPLLVTFGCSTRHYPVSHIKHIRKPRKGGKEARDIVAIVARYFKEIRVKRFRDCIIAGKSKKQALDDACAYATASAVYDIYMEQKKRLGGSNDK